MFALPYLLYAYSTLHLLVDKHCICWRYAISCTTSLGVSPIREGLYCCEIADVVARVLLQLQLRLRLAIGIIALAIFLRHLFPSPFLCNDLMCLCMQIGLAHFSLVTSIFLFLFLFYRSLTYYHYFYNTTHFVWSNGLWVSAFISSGIEESNKDVWRM